MPVSQDKVEENWNKTQKKVLEGEKQQMTQIYDLSYFFNDLDHKEKKNCNYF